MIAAATVWRHCIDVAGLPCCGVEALMLLLTLPYAVDKMHSGVHIFHAPPFLPIFRDLNWGPMRRLAPLPRRAARGLEPVNMMSSSLVFARPLLL